MVKITRKEIDGTMTTNLSDRIQQYRIVLFYEDCSGHFHKFNQQKRRLHVYQLFELTHRYYLLTTLSKIKELSKLQQEQGSHLGAWQCCELSHEAFQVGL